METTPTDSPMVAGRPKSAIGSYEGVGGVHMMSDWHAAQRRKHTRLTSFAHPACRTASSNGKQNSTLVRALHELRCALPWSRQWKVPRASPGTRRTGCVNVNSEAVSVRAILILADNLRSQ